MEQQNQTYGFISNFPVVVHSLAMHIVCPFHLVLRHRIFLMQSKILRLSCNGMVLDDHGKYFDSWLWPYWLEDDTSTTTLCRLPFYFFLGVCLVLYCTEKRLIKCGEPTQTQLRGRGRALQHNFFFRRVSQERDGGRERCLLWRKVWGNPSPRRIRMPYRDGVPEAGQPTAWTALHSGAQVSRQGHILFDALSIWS